MLGIKHLFPTCTSVPCMRKQKHLMCQNYHGRPLELSQKFSWYMLGNKNKSS